MKKRQLRRKISALVLTLVLTTSAIPVSAEESAEKNRVQGVEQETEAPVFYADDSRMILPEPGSTTEMVLDQDYQLQNPGGKTNSYKFVFRPTESAGYYLDFYGELWNYEMQITCQVLDDEENLLAGSRGYYMLEAGKSYTFQIENYTTLIAERSAGRLTMEKYCDWNECLKIDERGYVTGMAEAFKIVCIPEGVKGMDKLYYLHQNIGTLILPESIQNSVNTLAFWRANYRYETPKTGGRYLAVDGVLYDQIDQVMVNIPLVREGSYTVREGTKTIASGAFRATRLSEIVFPDSVTQFNSRVFGNDNESVRKIMLPANAEGLDASQFYSLYSLEELVVPDNSENYRTIDGVLFKKNYDEAWELVFYPIGKSDISYTVPDNVSTLGISSFARAAKSGSIDYDPVRNLKFLTIPASVETLDWFLSTGGSNTSYTEMTLRGHEGSSAHEYWKKNFSNSDLIKWETIDEAGEEDSKEFTLGRDNNNFIHWGWDSEGSGFYGCDRYWLDEEDYDRLFSHEISKGKKNELREKIYKKQAKDAGHCFGISSVLGMVYNDVLDMGDITDSGAPWVYGLPKPCEDPKYLSTIDYYHLMQYLYNPRENNLAYIYNKFHEDTWWTVFYPEWIQWIYANKGEISSKEDISNFFNTARKELDEGGCLLLGIPSHLVVLTGYEKTDTGYSFQIYDPNSVMKSEEKGAFYYLETNEDMTKFSCNELNLSEEDYLELCLLDPSQIDLMQNRDGQTNEDDRTGITKIILDLGTEFTVTDENGDRISSEAGSPEDITMDITDLQLISSDPENYTSSEGSLSVKGGEQYSLSDPGVETDITIYNDDGYLSLSGSNIDSAEMIPGEGIEIKGKNNCSFTVVIDTDQVLETEETGLVEVSGTTDGGTIRIETKENSETETDEVIVNVSDKTFQNLTANSYTKNGTVPLDIKDSLIAKESISFYAEELPDTDNGDPDQSDSDDTAPEQPDGDNGKQPPTSENKGDGTAVQQKDSDGLKKENGEESSDKTQAVQTGEEKWSGYVVTFLGAVVMICCIAYLRYRRKKDI